MSEHQEHFENTNGNQLEESGDRPEIYSDFIELTPVELANIKESEKDDLAEVRRSLQIETYDQPKNPSEYPKINLANVEHSQTGSLSPLLQELQKARLRAEDQLKQAEQEKADDEARAKEATKLANEKAEAVKMEATKQLKALEQKHQQQLEALEQEHRQRRQVMDLDVQKRQLEREAQSRLDEEAINKTIQDKYEKRLNTLLAERAKLNAIYESPEDMPEFQKNNLERQIQSIDEHIGWAQDQLDALGN